ncbi:hypothetical protein FQN55_005524 [Onygenales sp. PD_40]|nr:hypothetical protein FQN55_005524 [Onygenales sp. PD_40]KAK2773466.1 hypothetical protein FQN53_004145 [Emmonsiellopsis sp. PD_33]
MEDPSTSRPETPIPPHRITPQEPAGPGSQFFSRFFGSSSITTTPTATATAATSQSPSVSDQRETPSPPTPTTPTQAAEMPATLGVRPSRASSIISTMTSSTIATLQDDARSMRSARSVDLVLGGRLFHINRDASKISVSTDSDLPPYSPPVPPYPQSGGGSGHVETEPAPTPVPTTRVDSAVSNPPRPWVREPTTPTATPAVPATPRSRLHIPFLSSDKPRHRRQSSSSSLRSRFLNREPPQTSLGLSSSNSMLDLSNLPSARKSNTSEIREEQRVFRTPSFNPGPERISVIPKRRSVSQGYIPDHMNPHYRNNKDANPRLRRRNGVRLPRLFTALSDGRFGSSPDQEQDAGPQIIQSAGPSFNTLRKKRSQSPIFTSRNPTTPSGFPNHPYQSSSATHLSPNNNSTAMDQRRPSLPTIYPNLALAMPHSPAEIEESHADDTTARPPPMEDENDISIHYTRLIRSIDRDHRKALHARDQELAAMRERLNEIDQVYRTELRSRDFTIDDLRQRLEALQEGFTTGIEKAKNEVEDLWEMRWKHRDRHLMERMRRIEVESQVLVERAVAERDEEWAGEWAERNRLLLERLRVAEQAAGRS